MLALQLWGAVVISVLFWTLANEVCSVAEARTVYPMMGIAANFALVRGWGVGGRWWCWWWGGGGNWKGG